jgi:hypothetical protein
MIWSSSRPLTTSFSSFCKKSFKSNDVQRRRPQRPLLLNKMHYDAQSDPALSLSRHSREMQQLSTSPWTDERFSGFI